MSVPALQEHPAPRRTSAAQRAAVAIGVIAGLCLTVIWASPDGHRSARAAVAIAGETPQPTDAQRGLDYFPDHYQLQAKDAAEEIAMF